MVKASVLREKPLYFFIQRHSLIQSSINVTRGGQPFWSKQRIWWRFPAETDAGLAGENLMICGFEFNLVTASNEMNENVCHGEAMLLQLLLLLLMMMMNKKKKKTLGYSFGDSSPRANHCGPLKSSFSPWPTRSLLTLVTLKSPVEIPKCTHHHFVSERGDNKNKTNKTSKQKQPRHNRIERRESPLSDFY